MRIALYEPDIAPNVGTILRLAACLDLPVDIIEPCGFALSEKSLRRSGMDYMDHVRVARHDSWRQFCEIRPQSSRLVLLTTGATQPFYGFEFATDDILLFGRESAGVPQAVHDAADARLIIPMAPGLRSLNVAMAAAMVVGEALRQTESFPGPPRQAGVHA